MSAELDVSPAALTWVLDAQHQKDSTVASVAGAVAGDGHRAVHGHLVLFAVLGYVQRVGGELRRNNK